MHRAVDAVVVIISAHFLVLTLRVGCNDTMVTCEVSTSKLDKMVL